MDQIVLEINIISANSSTVNVNGNNHNTKVYINNNLIIDSSYFNYKTLHLQYDFPTSNIFLQNINMKFPILAKEQIIRILHLLTYLSSYI